MHNLQSPSNGKAHPNLVENEVASPKLTSTEKKQLIDKEIQVDEPAAENKYVTIQEIENCYQQQLD